MSMPGWRAGLVLAALLFILGTLYTLALRLETTAAFPERVTFRSLIRLDAELNRDLLLLQSGLLRHYDPINATIVTMYQRLAALRSEGPEPLRENLAALAEMIKFTEEQVERFKSDIAVSHNSIMYLTLQIERRLEHAASGENAVLNLLLARLDNTLVRYISNPRGQTREPVEAVLQDISARVWSGQLRGETYTNLLDCGRDRSVASIQIPNY